MKWQSCLDQVLDQMARGTLRVGDRFPTLDELCRRYGISNITARRIFQELTSRGMIASRPRRGTFVTRIASRETVYMCLRQEAFQDGGDLLTTIGFLHPFSLGFSTSDMGSMFELKPMPIDYCLAHLQDFAGKPMLVSANVALKMDGTRVRIDHALVRRLHDQLQPVFFHAFPGLRGVFQVGADLHASTCQATRHLLEQGHTRIGLIGGDTRNPWFHPRFLGYLDALREADIGLNPEWVKVSSAGNPDEDQAAAAQLLACRPRPTAVVCINDRRALALLKCCRQQGLRVPEDLAVTGGDNIPESAVCQPPLTTFDGRDRDQGAFAADLLARRMRGDKMAPVAKMFEPHIIIRKSSGLSA